MEGLDAGANDYIAKPYDNEELLARIRVGQRMVELQTNLHETKQALAYEALHDPLTGVFNRRAILDSLKQEIARSKRQGIPLSVALCDIDHFKIVNDTYGHQVGDDALCGFVQRIKDNLREYDQVGRYGGEEFLMITPGSEGDEQEGLFERLRSSVANQEFTTRSGDIAITVSIGVAKGNGMSSVDEMLASADAALYRAKNEGRNRVVYAEQRALKPDNDEGQLSPNQGVTESCSESSRLRTESAGEETTFRIGVYKYYTVSQLPTAQGEK